MQIESRFPQFLPYARKLQRRASIGTLGDHNEWNTFCASALDGEPGRELRALAPIENRRERGAFFTGGDLARVLASHISIHDYQSKRIYDPTCGVADLLLAFARRLPIRRNLSETLRSWAKLLAGSDVEPAFIAAAKARLVLLARQRHGEIKSARIEWKDSFPLLSVGDGLRNVHSLRRATDILLNPPYAQIPAPKECSWAHGKVTAAALFVEHALQNIHPGSRILAILPEVLRTGTRYEKWRALVLKGAKIVHLQSYGVFDSSADVDVFVLVLKKRYKVLKKSAKKWPANTASTNGKLGDFFKVSVGAVVPYRDPRRGKSRAYIHPRNTPAWKTLRRIDERRRFDGKIEKGPFVVLRRTSRPGDRWRATASIIAGKRSVAVENHLIVCRPYAGGLSACKALARALRTAEVNNFLDREMRCRHLTVGIVAKIPVTLRLAQPHRAKV